jgi:hypothetical protein
MAMDQLDSLPEENAPKPGEGAEQGGEVVVAHNQARKIVDLGEEMEGLKLSLGSAKCHFRCSKNIWNFYKKYL